MSALAKPVHPSATTFHQVLTSVERNLETGDWSMEPGVLRTLGFPGYSVSKRRLRGGRQEGVDLITVGNGRIAVTVIPTRGMGILRVDSPTLCLGWDSPVRQVVNPRFINLHSRGGLGWLEGFNEWLVRCGLEFRGGPGRDRFVTNTGDEAEMELTLHGKIANIPAAEVELIIDPAPPFALRLRGRVDETMFYGPKLQLWTELVLEPESAGFQLHDTITNLGGAEQEFELIYHINFGPPLLDAGAQFGGAVRRVIPMNAHAARSVSSYASYAGATPGFVEQVYCMEPIPDGKGRFTTLLQNAAGDRAASMSYSLRQLPCFTLWKNTNLPQEGCVTGLEPGTNFPHNRRTEREAGRLGKLRPGEHRDFTIDFKLHGTREEVAEILRSIESVQGAVMPELERSA